MVAVLRVSLLRGFLTFAFAGVSLSTFVGCQKDFDVVVDWIDYQSTQLPPPSKEIRTTADIPDQLVSDILRTTVTIQNFQLARFDDENMATESLPSDSKSTSWLRGNYGVEMLRKVVADALSSLSDPVQKRLVKTSDCADQSHLSDCLTQKILGQISFEDPERTARLVQYYLPKLKEIFSNLDPLSEHIFFQRAHQALARMAQPTEGSGKDSLSLGSGFFMLENDELYVVTNNHVVERNFDELEKQKHPSRFKYSFVYLVPDEAQAGRYRKATASATLVARDPLFFDSALLKVDDQSLKTKVKIMPFGDESPLRTGDLVIAAGSPHGLSSTLTFGQVNYVNRYIGGIRHYSLQHSATIRPGNSGGPLFNRNGEIVGLNTYLLAQTYGLAIPVSSFTRYLKKRLLERNYDYYIAERAFIKVPEEGYNVTLDLHLGANRSADYTRLNGTNLLMVSAFQPLEFNADYKPDTAPRLGALFSRYRIDGVEKPIDSASQIEFDLAYSKEGRLEIFVADPSSLQHGTWVPVRTRKFTYADYRVGDKMVKSSFMAAQVEKIQGLRETLEKGARDGTIQYYVMDGDVNGRLYEYDFDQSGTKNLLYISDRDTLVFSKFNNQPISTIEDFRRILTAHMNERNGAGSVIPVVSFEFRNLRVTIPEYAKAIVGLEVEKISTDDTEKRRKLFGQTVALFNKSPSVNVFKIFRGNIKKMLAAKPTEVKMEIRSKVDLPTPEKNEARFLQSLIPWAFGPALAATYFKLSGKNLDGRSETREQIATFWWKLEESFSLIPEAKNCFRSGNYVSVAGLGDLPDQYRYCANQAALDLDSSGAMSLVEDAKIAVFRNTLAGPGKTLDEEKRAAYRVIKDPSFDLFNVLAEIKASDFIDSVKNYDLAEIPSLRFEGLEHLWQAKVVATMNQGVATRDTLKAGPALVAKRRKVGSPTDLFSVFDSPYFYQSALNNQGKPYLWIEDLKQIAGASDTLPGFIFDLRADANGNLPLKSTFHLFKPRLEEAMKLKEVYEPAEWKRLSMDEISTREAKLQLPYQWNPDMRVAVIEINVEKLENKLKHQLGISDAKNASFPVQMDKLLITVFYKKDRNLNAINFFPIVSGHFNFEKLQLFGEKGSLYETQGFATIITNQPYWSRKEIKENRGSRWGHFNLFGWSRTLQSNVKD